MYMQNVLGYLTGKGVAPRVTNPGFEDMNLFAQPDPIYNDPNSGIRAALLGGGEILPELSARLQQQASLGMGQFTPEGWDERTASLTDEAVKENRSNALLAMGSALLGNTHNPVQGLSQGAASLQKLGRPDLIRQGIEDSRREDLQKIQQHGMYGLRTSAEAARLAGSQGGKATQADKDKAARIAMIERAVKGGKIDQATGNRIVGAVGSGGQAGELAYQQFLKTFHPDLLPKDGEEPFSRQDAARRIETNPYWMERIRGKNWDPRVEQVRARVVEKIRKQYESQGQPMPSGKTLQTIIRGDLERLLPGVNLDAMVPPHYEGTEQEKWAQAIDDYMSFHEYGLDPDDPEGTGYGADPRYQRKVPAAKSDSELFNRNRAAIRKKQEEEEYDSRYDPGGGGPRKEPYAGQETSTDVVSGPTGEQAIAEMVGFVTRKAKGDPNAANYIIMDLVDSGRISEEQGEVLRNHIPGLGEQGLLEGLKSAASGFILGIKNRNRDLSKQPMR